MLCRNCRYPLRGLASRHCPECGTAFAPDDPRSWRQPRKAAPYWLCLLGFPVGWLAMLGLYLASTHPTGFPDEVVHWDEALIIMFAAGTIVGSILCLLMLITMGTVNVLLKHDE